jgi:hypothetical protein
MMGNIQQRAGRLTRRLHSASRGEEVGPAEPSHKKEHTGGKTEACPTTAVSLHHSLCGRLQEQ